MTENYSAINWNAIDDQIDKATWEKLTEQFWLDTRIPLSNDLSDWRTFDEDHQWVVGHVFGGLTLLDTLQSQEGMASLRKMFKPNMKQPSSITSNLWNLFMPKVIHPFSQL